MTAKIKLPNRQAATWTTAAMAAAAGGSAQAELVQIDLIGNQINVGGGNQLFADLDGDGTPDVTFANAEIWNNETFTYSKVISNYVYTTTSSTFTTTFQTVTGTKLANGAAVEIDGSYGAFVARSSGPVSSLTDIYRGTYSDNGDADRVTLYPITLSDQPVANAWLEVTLRANGPSAPTVGDPGAGVYLSRVIYDTDNSAGTPVVGQPYRQVGSADASGYTPAGPGSLVQIDLVGNKITASGNELFADLDGDGINDVVFSPPSFNGNVFPSVQSNSGTNGSFGSNSSYLHNGARINIDSVRLSARSYGYTSSGFFSLNTRGPGPGPKGVMEVSLSGQPGVKAWLEMERRTNGWGEDEFTGDPDTGVYLSRVIYDPTNNATPYDFLTEQYTSIGSTENGVFTPAGGDIEVTAFSVSGGTATITIKGTPNTEYTCKSSTTLSGFTEIIPTSGSTTTDGSGDATFEVDATGPKRFYVVEDVSAEPS